VLNEPAIYYVTWFIILVASVFVLDFLRGGDADKIAMMFKTGLIPVICFAILLLIPAKFKGSVQAKPVPERVTS